MNHDEKADLREMRDMTERVEDKKLLRKAVNYIATLEARLFAVRVHARSILSEVSGKGQAEED